MSFSSMAGTESAKFSGSKGLLEWQISHDVDRDILRLQTSGPLDMHSLEAFFDAVYEASSQCSCRRYFADHRSSRLRLNPAQIYDLPKTLRQHGITKQVAAVLFAEIGEDERFVEIVCKNFGITARIFSDQDSALNWLAATAAEST